MGEAAGAGALRGARATFLAAAFLGLRVGVAADVAVESGAVVFSVAMLVPLSGFVCAACRRLVFRNQMIVVQCR